MYSLFFIVLLLLHLNLALSLPTSNTSTSASAAPSATSTSILKDFPDYPWDTCTPTSPNPWDASHPWTSDLTIPTTGTGGTWKKTKRQKPYATCAIVASGRFFTDHLIWTTTHLDIQARRRYRFLITTASTVASIYMWMREYDTDEWIIREANTLLHYIEFDSPLARNVQILFEVVFLLGRNPEDPVRRTGTISLARLS
ncbi:MAG: hypothetical protein Q9220_002669 [cf. Caloplaca sp. 1 TL-2023]